MDMDDFKVGDVVLVRGRVVEKDAQSVGFETIDQHGDVLMEYSFRLWENELDAVVKVDKPKYDTCRLFRKGDKARVVERFGRRDATLALGELVTVTENECGVTFIRVKDENGCDSLIAWNFLELVTPVEETLPYSVEEGNMVWSVSFNKHKAGEVYVSRYFTATHPNAKAAAEAECDRLNAEWQAKACRSEEGKEEDNELV